MAHERRLATEAGIEILDNHTVIGSIGRRHVSGLMVAPMTASGGVGDVRTLSCDVVGISGGWTPVVHLASQSGARLDFAEALDAFLPSTAKQNMRSAGACLGHYELGACLADGFRAGGAEGGEGVRRRTGAGR